MILSNHLRCFPCIESNHLPVGIVLKMNTASSVNSELKENPKPTWINKLIWDKTKETDFLANFNSDIIRDMCARAVALIDYNIDQALELFTSSLLRASECMKKHMLTGNRPRDSLWFDDECRKAKTDAKLLLRTFKRSGFQSDRVAYVAARKIYKTLIRKKKMGYKREKARRLASFDKDPRSFWRELRQLSGRKNRVLSKDITDCEWYEHFKCVFSEINTPFSNLTFGNDAVNDNIETLADLNRSIDPQEVREAIRKLKTGKAHGTDGILAEMLKVAGETAVQFLTKLFNVLFDQGVYPEEWSKAIIVPIFKKGKENITDNYRGISLLSLISKCYTSVLNKRLVTWAEENGKLSEAQAGFRKGYSTTDHIFTLNAIVEKSLSKRGGKLYTCFVDLKKAFDSVQRGPLFHILCQNGLSGKFLNALSAIYKSVVSCVRIGDRLTEFFDCPAGLRQGCILSPMLFSLFINEIASSVEQQGMHGIQLLPGLVEIFLLLFADDIVLISDTPRGLQNQLDVLSSACKDLFLHINTDKTKVMVFRKGGFLGKHEKWHLDGNNIEVVNEYTYLGYTFTTKMSVTKGVDVLAAKGKRACVECVRYIGKLSEISKKCFFKIFDTQVQPVILYSAEIWGLHRLSNVERVHTFACKRYLNVPLKVPNKFVYGETGRYPLYVNSAVRCIRYWLRILKLDPDRLPKQAYTMLFNMDERGKNCWATSVRKHSV